MGFLSSGPDDPTWASLSVGQIDWSIDQVPLFGIQIVSGTG